MTTEQIRQLFADKKAALIAAESKRQADEASAVIEVMFEFRITAVSAA